MYKLFLSVRYLKTRIISYVAIVGMAIGVLALVTVLSVMAGFQVEFRKRIRGTQAHLTVDTSKFFGLKEWPKVREKLLAAGRAAPQDVPPVTGAAPFIRNIVLVKGPFTKDYGFIQGIVPEDESAVSELGDYLLSDYELLKTLGDERVESTERYLQTRTDLPKDNPRHMSPTQVSAEIAKMRERLATELGGLSKEKNVSTMFEHKETDLPGLVVGLEFFKYYLLQVGGTVTLLTTSDVEKEVEEIQSRTQRFEVTGVFKTGIWDVDRRTCMASLSATQEFILGNADSVTGIHLAVTDFDHADRTAAYLEQALKQDPDYTALGLRVSTWEAQNKQLLSAVDMEKRLLGIILFFMVVVAGMNIVSILSMSVVEKTKDLGIIKAVGGTGTGVVSIFLAQGLLIGALGSGLGTVGGLSLVRWINEVADGIKAVTGYHPFPHNIYYLDRIPTLVDPVLIASIVVPTVLVSLIFALYPAWKAGRLDPIEALRHD